MRVVICWSDISGYMAACWRALARVPGIDLHVIGFAPTDAANIAFVGDRLLQGVSHALLPADGRNDAAAIERMVVERKPDVMVLAGWLHAPYVRLASCPALASARLVIGVDTPWRGDLRQRLARHRLRRYFARASAMVVPGERAWQYAVRLGIPEGRIFRGMYGIDYGSFAPSLARRATAPGGWPRQFVYAGRYVEEKGVDVLAAAYQQYRRAVDHPWPLVCCGRGPDAALLRGVDGIEDRGFVQPDDQPGEFAKAGVFVLASRYDPWPLVVVEACASGLPVLCTNACGSAVELVRPSYNGLRVATGSAEAMAAGMRWMHEHHTELPEYGRRSAAMAAPHDAAVWVRHWVDHVLTAGA
jgi:glycosyltransferase involved in cell wall biosynthesis